MCNIAGYVGERRAAPILIEMIKAQEGLNGGHFSGIATLHEGKIYYEKLTGDFDRLVALKHIEELPGNIGIIHSRTPSGGGDEWAHPFVYRKEGRVQLAYVANGSAGMFKARNDEYNRMTWDMLGEGWEMDSRVRLPNPRYQILPDGTAVHMSDVMCQLIAKHTEEGKSEDRAMAEAFCDMPGEIVGLLLSLATPDKIAYARINMPMFVGFTSHGAYLASAPQAFPADFGGELHILPALSSGFVGRDFIESAPFSGFPVAVEEVTPAMKAAAYEALSALLSGGEVTCKEIFATVKPLFSASECIPIARLAYEILYEFKKEGRLFVRNETVKGSAEGLTAPVSYLSLR